MPEPTSTQAVMLFATLSALCRAGLNLIDRQQFGRQRLSIVQLSLWNNLLPALALAAGLLLAGRGGGLLAQLCDWRCAVFGALIQAVAYGFSWGFRHLTVDQATVAAKSADLLIPLGVLAAGGQWDAGHYLFAVLTTLVFLPILLHAPTRPRGRARAACLLIGGLLVLQGSAAPWLGAAAARPVSGNAAGFEDTLVFATAVILWRTGWSIAPLLRAGGEGLRLPPRDLLRRPLSLLRALLTVATQLGFVLAVSSAQAAVAWPILNSAGLMAMVLASLVLRETAHPHQRVMLLLVALLSLGRYLTL